MKAPVKAIQIVTALAIYNVWFVRPRRATPWRGGGAQSLEEEFAVYGLPPWTMWPVGALKVGSASLLLLGLRYPSVTRPAALGLAALMAGAAAMHLKVRDPIKRTLPALAMLALSLYVARYGSASS